MRRRPYNRRMWHVTWWLSGLLIIGLAAMPRLAAEELVVYGFEDGLQGWVIPEWAKSSADYVVTELSVSPEQAAEGHQSLRLQAAFPGERWTGGYVERELEVTDWGAFGRIAVSVYLPPEAPQGLRGRIIVTVGDQWQWTEMNRAVPLAPGSWTPITANLKPGSLDWKFFPTETFRKDVRKLGIRIESDKQPSYTGPVFLDNVRLAE